MPIDADKELLDESSIDLNTSPALPTCPVTVGMDVDGLAGTTRAALDKGYEDGPGKDSYMADGLPQTLEFSANGGKGPDPQAIEGGAVDSGFLGRSRLLSER
jgi:hypothetical protein